MILGIVSGLLAVASLTSSAVGGPPRPLAKTTPTRIEALAMDGSRVAYDVASRYGVPKQRCNTVYVWNVATGVTTAMSGKGTCDADNSSTGAGVRELAIAGTRAAWIVNVGGISESDDDLYTSSLPKPKERKLASAIRTGEVTGGLTCGGIHAAGLHGAWIGCLVASGNFLAVNRWSTDEDDRVTSARLQTIGTRLRTIASEAGAMDAVSTDGKQVAVLRADGSVGLYSAAGKLLRAVTPSSAREAAVRGDYLVVLTKTKTLEVFNSHSGKRLHTWRVANGARYVDVSSKLAAYAAPRTGGSYVRVVHVMSLSTGKDRVLATTLTRWRQVVEVQLEPTGLVYAVNRTRPSEAGYLLYTPMSRLPR